MPPKPIQEVLQEHTRAWMSLPGVQGTAVGELHGQPCLVVYVAQTTEGLKAAIPQSVEGYPVRLEQTGEFRAL